MANNVFAHVPDLVDFTTGLRALVADDGYVSIEIPHLLRLIERNEYDTIYHEHYSYLSLLTTQRVLATGGLEVVDVEELPTHGGSLRSWSARSRWPRTPARPSSRLAAERAAGLDTLDGHAGSPPRSPRCATTSSSSSSGASDEVSESSRTAPPGKGNTLLNHCGIRADLVEFSVDRNPFKHGRFLPGTHIPIHPVERRSSPPSRTTC